MTATPELYSPDEVAKALGVHVRTVRRFIRDGKLKATRVGKQYRVPAAALAELTGADAAQGLGPAVRRTRRVLVSTIVDIDAIDRPESDCISTALTGVFTAVRDGSGPKRIDSVYYEEQGRLRVVIHAAPGITASLLTMIEAILDDGARR